MCSVWNWAGLKLSGVRQFIGSEKTNIRCWGYGKPRPGLSNIVRTQHVAFAGGLEDMNDAIQNIKEKKIELRNFFDEVTDEPSVFGWMPAASIYFHDVDGHLLEFIARIDHEPLPDIGIVSLSEWNQRSGRVTIKQ